MAAAGTKIKVSRTALLARLQEIETEQQELYLDSLDTYGEDLVAFRKDLVEALAGLTLSLKAGLTDLDGFDNEYKGGIRLGIPDLQKPTEPKRPSSTLGKMIRTLELSGEDTILVSSTDDYSRYI